MRVANSKTTPSDQLELLRELTLDQIHFSICSSRAFERIWPLVVQTYTCILHPAASWNLENCPTETKGFPARLGATLDETKLDDREASAPSHTGRILKAVSMCREKHSTPDAVRPLKERNALG